jgi:molybdopterin molybdotransferase
MTDRAILDDCFLHDKDRLRHDEALAILKAAVAPVVGTERVSLDEASGRVLAEPVTSPRAVPADDNSAVDGYAFTFADYETTGGFFPVVERIAAGHPAASPLPVGAAARIFTGAVMPGRADSVAMQEDCESHDQDGEEFVVIPPGLKAGANCRLAGEDLAAGDAVAVAGQRLRPQDIAAIASTGQARISVFKPIKVALFSTGDEIVRPGKPLGDGQVYDSNHYLLRALLESVGAEISDLGILGDDAKKVAVALASAAAGHHAVLTTGGASRGEEDHLVTTLDRLGKRHLWQLAIKPGRPMTFGQIGKTIVLALPGNPVAAFVCFLLYARPVFSVLAGAGWIEPPRFAIPAGFEIEKKKPDRREFLRGTLTRENGRLEVQKFARDGSGLITSLREADGLIELDEETTELKRGDPVAFIPFSALGLTMS